MATKIECDICKKIEDYRKVGFIKIFNRERVDSGIFEETIDICEECKKKLIPKKNKRG